MKRYHVIWWDEDDKLEFELEASDIHALAQKLHDQLMTELQACNLWHEPPSVAELEKELELKGSQMFWEI